LGSLYSHDPTKHRAPFHAGLWHPNDGDIKFVGPGDLDSDTKQLAAAHNFEIPALVTTGPLGSLIRNQSLKSKLFKPLVYPFLLPSRSDTRTHSRIFDSEYGYVFSSNGLFQSQIASWVQISDCAGCNSPEYIDRYREAITQIENSFSSTPNLKHGSHYFYLPHWCPPHIQYGLAFAWPISPNQCGYLTYGEASIKHVKLSDKLSDLLTQFDDTLVAYICSLVGALDGKNVDPLVDPPVFENYFLFLYEVYGFENLMSEVINHKVELPHILEAYDFTFKSKKITPLPCTHPLNIFLSVQPYGHQFLRKRNFTHMGLDIVPIITRFTIVNECVCNVPLKYVPFDSKTTNCVWFMVDRFQKINRQHICAMTFEPTSEVICHFHKGVYNHRTMRLLSILLKFNSSHGPRDRLIECGLGGIELKLDHKISDWFIENMIMSLLLNDFGCLSLDIDDSLRKMFNQSFGTADPIHAFAQLVISCSIANFNIICWKMNLSYRSCGLNGTDLLIMEDPLGRILYNVFFIYKYLLVEDELIIPRMPNQRLYFGSKSDFTNIYKLPVRYATPDTVISIHQTHIQFPPAGRYCRKSRIFETFLLGCEVLSE
jgi:hypothetical protein